MTIEKRLEAIQELTEAVATLSKSKFKKYDLARVIAQLQSALIVIGIEDLNIDLNAYDIAEKINK